MITNNVHFAIYSNVNKLAERWGIKPHQFETFVRMEEGSENSYIKYVSCDKEILDNFNKMIASLAFGNSSDTPLIPDERRKVDLEGPAYELLKKLDKAIEIAPHARQSKL